MSNIVLFDAYAAEVFSQLYKNFPVCKDIYVEDIIKNAEHDRKESVERQREICSETMHWLREAEFISVKTPTFKDFYLNRDEHKIETVFTCVILTAKGLQILKQVPRSIKEGVTLGEEISDALKQGFKSRASELVSIALGSLVTGGIQ